MRLYRAVRWWWALRTQEPDMGLPWWVCIRIAWYWSSDKAAYEAAKRKRP